MESMWYLNMVGFFYLLTNEWQIDYLIIELYYLISKNQKMNFILFLILNILKCMRESIAQ